VRAVALRKAFYMVFSGLAKNLEVLTSGTAATKCDCRHWDRGRPPAMSAEREPSLLRHNAKIE
jgi:hypothetical protein